MASRLLVTKITNKSIETIDVNGDDFRARAEKSMRNGKTYVFKTERGWIAHMLCDADATDINDPATQMVCRAKGTDARVCGDVYLFCFEYGMVCGFGQADWRDKYIRDLLIYAFFGFGMDRKEIA